MQWACNLFVTFFLLIKQTGRLRWRYVTLTRADDNQIGPPDPRHVSKHWKEAQFNYRRLFFDLTVKLRPRVCKFTLIANEKTCTGTGWQGEKRHLKGKSARQPDNAICRWWLGSPQATSQWSLLFAVLRQHLTRWPSSHWTHVSTESVTPKNNLSLLHAGIHSQITWHSLWFMSNSRNG